jgi:RND family efflux transporter MFP subunit
MSKPNFAMRLSMAAGMALLLMATACGPAPTATPLPTSAAPQATPPPPGTITASAVVVPAQQSKLAFLISGTLKELAVNVGDPVAAGQKLAEISAPDLEYAVLQAEEAVRAAEFRYQYWIPARLDRPPERRLLAEQEYIQVQRSLDTAKAALTQATLNAPFDGIVADIQAVQGELVQPGQVLMTVADLEHLRIETTDLSERDLPKVQVGQTAQVHIEALDQTLDGRVAAIAPVADKLGGDVIYRVTIDLDTVPETLRWGMTAEVNIQTQ